MVREARQLTEVFFNKITHLPKAPLPNAIRQKDMVDTKIQSTVLSLRKYFIIISKYKNCFWDCFKCLFQFHGEGDWFGFVVFMWINSGHSRGEKTSFKCSSSLSKKLLSTNIKRPFLFPIWALLRKHKNKHDGSLKETRVWGPALMCAVSMTLQITSLQWLSRDYSWPTQNCHGA